LADLNGDDLPDMITSLDGGRIGINLNTGNPSGSLILNTTTTIMIPGAGNDLQRLDVGDVNGDGRIDAVVANRNGNIHVLIGNGSGGFPTIRTIPVTNPALADLDHVHLGDVDGDSDLDVVVGYDSNGPIPVLLNDGTGQFGSQVEYLTAYRGRRPIIVDVNGDAAGDLVVGNINSDHIAVLLSDGEGRFP
jgi:hypothetical protein